jgi:hypothetical protein
MKTFKITPLALAIAVPIAMILLVAASIYLPRLWAHPSYNFLYSTSSYYGGPVFDVRSGVLEKQEQPAGLYPPGAVPTPTPDTTLYVYHIADKTSQEISFEDAQKLHLSAKSTSPDGFTVTGPGGDTPVSIFGGPSDYTAQYITGKGVRIKLELEKSGPVYGSNPGSFIGWILP